MRPSAGQISVFAGGIAFVLRAAVLAVLGSALLLVVLGGVFPGLVAFAQLTAVVLHLCHLAFSGLIVPRIPDGHTYREKNDTKK